jgi:hypothetical protein
MSVKLFNTLPRPQLMPTGLPNDWHFDLRYIPLDPTPSHFLFIVQQDSNYTHGERLPLGVSTDESGIAFFPESGTEAASEVSKALIHAFVDGFGNHKFMLNPHPPFAPWKLTTEDPHLAKGVSEEFMKIGVQIQLCNIHVVKGKALETAQTAFESFWNNLKSRIGITGIVADALTTPNSITFHNFQPKTTTTRFGDDSDDEDSAEISKALGYVQRLSSSRPISLNIDPHDQGKNTMKEVQSTIELFKAKSSKTVRKEADAGNAESAIEYALRFVRRHFLDRHILTNVHIPVFNSALTAPKTVHSVVSTSSKLSPLLIPLRLPNHPPMRFS